MGKGAAAGVLRLTVIASGVFVLELIQDFAVNRRVMLDPVWTGVFVAGALLFGTLWTVKRKGLLRPPEDRSGEQKLPAARR